MIKVCEYCGKEFETDRECKRFCNRSCKERNSKKRIKSGERLDNVEYIRVCPECGKEFVTNNVSKLYCSRKCFNKFKYKNNIESLKEYHKEYYVQNKEYFKEYFKNKIYKQVCLSCGKEFESKSTGTKYCEDCHAQKLYVKKCKCCGKEFVGQGNKCNICKDIKMYYLCECKECGKLFLSKTKSKSICSKECNKIKKNKKVKIYRDNPDSNYKSSQRKYKNKRMKTSEGKLRRFVQDIVRRCLKNKNGETCFKYLDYTVNDLKIHLEKQFESDMSWENYGTLWNIDHIRPVASYKYVDADGNILSENVKLVNSLDNLKPMYKEDNLFKSSKYNGCVYRKGEILYTLN